MNFEGQISCIDMAFILPNFLMKSLSNVNISLDLLSSSFLDIFLLSNVFDAVVLFLLAPNFSAPKMMCHKKCRKTLQNIPGKGFLTLSKRVSFLDICCVNQKLKKITRRHLSFNMLFTNFWCKKEDTMTDCARFVSSVI